MIWWGLDVVFVESQWYLWMVVNTHSTIESRLFFRHHFLQPMPKSMLGMAKEMLCKIVVLWIVNTTSCTEIMMFPEGKYLVRMFYNSIGYRNNALFHCFCICLFQRNQHPSCQQNLKVVASFETSGCSLFFLLWHRVTDNPTQTPTNGSMSTRSSLFAKEKSSRPQMSISWKKIAFCHGHNLKSTVFQIEDDTDYFFLYLLTLSLISEASSLYIIEEKEITAFLEADDSTKKSLQNKIRM